MTWLVLVLPATFAEVIGVSLRRSGPGGYLHVQLFTAFCYIGAFIFGKSHRQGRPSLKQSNFGSSLVFSHLAFDSLTLNNIGWALRAWKVWELKQVRLDKEQRELAIRDEGILSSAIEHQSQNSDRATPPRRRSSILKGLWAIERV